MPPVENGRRPDNHCRRWYITPLPRRHRTRRDAIALLQMTTYDTAISPAAASAPGAAGQQLKLSVIVPVFNERHLVEASLRRLLAVRGPSISALEIIVVDDASTDGSGDVLKKLRDECPDITLIRHDTNRGKGAAIRTGLAHTTGDVVVFHDSDLEYDPRDLPEVMRPFVEAGADAVFGSRYMVAQYRRALGFRHSLVNRALSFLTSWFTDLYLTDVETCYKAVRTTLLKSIPIRSNDFRIEIELTLKLAKRRAHIFEVPIRYMPRSLREGKKIRPVDGLQALGALIKYSLLDDIYSEDDYGSHILHQLERTRRINVWMGDTLRPFVRDRVLEIGSGIGNLTEQFIPRELYVASDLNPNYLEYLRGYAIGKPYLEVRDIDVTRERDFASLGGRFDTVVIVNVLEHVADPALALANIHRSLAPGGRVIVLVPQHPWLYGTLDEALEHRERYTPQSLTKQLADANFVVEEMVDFNRTSVPAWWFNGIVMKRRVFSRVQLKTFDTAIPIVRRIDRIWPWSGQSLVAVARRP
jgi:glycosyltransferase involved in cell wall biosynthesis